MITKYVLEVDGSNWVREEDYRRLELNAGNLLALIHRDGGHYINDNGWDKAFSDAINVVNQLRIDLDAIQYTYESALDECQQRRLETIAMVEQLKEELNKAKTEGKYVIKNGKWIDACNIYRGEEDTAEGKP